MLHAAFEVRGTAVEDLGADDVVDRLLAPAPLDALEHDVMSKGGAVGRHAVREAWADGGRVVAMRGWQRASLADPAAATYTLKYEYEPAARRGHGVFSLTLADEVVDACGVVWLMNAVMHVMGGVLAGLDPPGIPFVWAGPRPLDTREQAALRDAAESGRLPLVPWIVFFPPERRRTMAERFVSRRSLAAALQGFNAGHRQYSWSAAPGDPRAPQEEQMIRWRDFLQPVLSASER